MKSYRQMAAALGALLIIMGGTAYAAPQTANWTVAANTYDDGRTITGKPDYDSNPGPGDTDINNDGRNDMQQIQNKASEIGTTLENGARKLGNEAQKQVDKIDNNLPDLNDRDVVNRPWFTWMLIGIGALMLLMIVTSMISRRRRYHYRRH